MGRYKKKSEQCCSICESDHDSFECRAYGAATFIPNVKVESRARLTLPPILSVCTDGKGIITSKPLAAGTWFGPLEAPRVLENGIIEPWFLLKILTTDGKTSFLLKTDNEEECNWLCLVRPAKSANDRNVIAFQIKDDIMFLTTREILAGEELKVWYSPSYAAKLKRLPVPEDDMMKIVMKDLKCGMRGRPKRQIPCKYCGVSTNGRQSLLEHIASVHGIVLNVPLPRQQNKQNDSKLDMDDRTEQLQLDHKLEHSNKSQLNSDETDAIPSERVSQNSCEERNIYSEMDAMNGDEDILLKTTDVVIESKADSNSHDHGASLDESACQEHRNFNYHVTDGVHVDASTNENSDLGDKVFKNNNVEGDDYVQENHGAACGGLVDNSFNEMVNRDKDVSKTVEEQVSQLLDIDVAEVADTDRDNECQDQISKFPCPMCKVAFRLQAQLERHLCEADAGPGDFLCSLCPKTFNKPKLLELHKEYHENKEAHCDYCHRSFRTHEDYQTHTCHTETMQYFRCEHCRATFRNYSYLEAHLESHEPRHVCRLCATAFVTAEYLSKHIPVCQGLKSLRENHATQCQMEDCLCLFVNDKQFLEHIETHRKPYRCEKCGAHFRRRITECIHVCDSSSAEKTEHVCELCNEKFKSKSMLLKHCSTKHIETASAFSCEYCSKKFPRKDTLLRHTCPVNTDPLRMHTIDGKEYRIDHRICDSCGVSFSSKSALNAHMKIHGERSHVCHLCNKAFHRGDTLRIHYQSHKTEKDYACKVCNKTFKTLSSLRIHSRMHDAAAKRHVCDVCGHSFLQKANLVKHKERHDASRCYKCQYCDKTFLDSTYVKIHELEHTSLTRYACHLCQKTFVKVHLLNFHMRYAHVNTTFICEICGVPVKMRHSLKRHMQRKHTDCQHIWDKPDYFRHQKPIECEPVEKRTFFRSKASSVTQDTIMDASEGAVLNTDDHVSSALPVGLEQILLLSEFNEAAGSETIELSQIENTGTVQTFQEFEDSSIVLCSESAGEVNGINIDSLNAEQSVHSNEEEFAIQIPSDSEFGNIIMDDVTNDAIVVGDTSSIDTSAWTTLTVTVNGVQTRIVLPTANPSQEEIREVLEKVAKMQNLQTDVE